MSRLWFIVLSLLCLAFVRDRSVVYADSSFGLRLVLLDGHRFEYNYRDDASHPSVYYSANGTYYIEDDTMVLSYECFKPTKFIDTFLVLVSKYGSKVPDTIQVVELNKAKLNNFDMYTTKFLIRDSVLYKVDGYLNGIEDSLIRIFSAENGEQL